MKDEETEHFHSFIWIRIILICYAGLNWKKEKNYKINLEVKIEWEFTEML